MITRDRSDATEPVFGYDNEKINKGSINNGGLTKYIHHFCLKAGFYFGRRYAGTPLECQNNIEVREQMITHP